MKKALSAIFAILILLALCSCRGNALSVEIMPVQSDIYTNKDIREAIQTAINYFEREFSGCILKEIHYIGDEAKESFDEWAEQYHADSAIVLTSTFDVDSSGGDGSLEPNSTYENWQWVLVRSAYGGWRNVTHGYA